MGGQGKLPLTLVGIPFSYNLWSRFGVSGDSIFAQNGTCHFCPKLNLSFLPKTEPAIINHNFFPKLNMSFLPKTEPVIFAQN
jgi:hypothetical protein